MNCTFRIIKNGLWSQSVYLIDGQIKKHHESDSEVSTPVLRLISFMLTDELLEKDKVYSVYID